MIDKMPGTSGEDAHRGIMRGMRRGAMRGINRRHPSRVKPEEQSLSKPASGLDSGKIASLWTQQSANSKGAVRLKPDDGHSGTIEQMREKFDEKVCELAKLGLYSMHDYAASSIPLNKPEGNPAIQQERIGNDEYIGRVNQSKAWWYMNTLGTLKGMFDRFGRSNEFQEACELALKEETRDEQSKREALKNTAEDFEARYTSHGGAVDAATDHYKFIESLEPDKIVKARQIQFIQLHVERLEGYRKAASDRVTNLKSFHEGVEAHIKAIKKIIRDLDIDKTNKASQDREALEKLITELKGFKEALQEAEDKENKVADATEKTRATIVEPGSTVNNMKEKIDSNKGFIAEAKAAEEMVLSNGKQVLEALKGYLDSTNYQKQAIEKLRELNKRLISEDSKKEEERTRPYLPIDIGAGKLSLPDEQGRVIWFDEDIS